MIKNDLDSDSEVPLEVLELDSKKRHNDAVNFNNLHVGMANRIIRGIVNEEQLRKKNISKNKINLMEMHVPIERINVPAQLSEVINITESKPLSNPQLQMNKSEETSTASEPIVYLPSDQLLEW